MNQKNISKKHLRIIKLVAIICISFLFGAYLGGTNKVSFFNKSYLAAERQKSYDAALKYARDRLIAQNLMSQSVTSINSATVKSVSGQTVVVGFKASEIDLFKDGKITRTIQIPSSVTIEHRINKTPEEVKSITDAYNKKMKAILVNKKLGRDVRKEIQNLKAPELYTIKQIQVKDLKAGDVISVQSLKDIYSNKTVEASVVRLINHIVAK